MGRSLGAAAFLGWAILFQPLAAFAVNPAASWVLDDFDDPARNGTTPERTNLWGGSWAVTVSQGSFAVSYNGPGADGTPHSAGVTGDFKGSGYAVFFCPLFKNKAPLDAAAAGLTGLQFWMKGDGRPYRVNVMSRAVTDSNYYGTQITPPVGTWIHFNLPFKDMTRLSFWGRQTGLPARTAAKDLTGFQLVPQSLGIFSYSLDEVSFIRAPSQVPESSPATAPAGLPSDQDPILVLKDSPAGLFLSFADGPGRYQAEVMDANGKLIRILFDQQESYSSSAWVEWDGKNSEGLQIPAGRYFLKLSKDGRVLKSMMILKYQSAGLTSP